MSTPSSSMGLPEGRAGLARGDVLTVSLKGCWDHILKAALYDPLSRVSWTHVHLLPLPNRD